MSIVRELRDLMSRVSKMEMQVAKLPTRIGSAIGGSGSGSGSGGWITAATYPLLPSPSSYSITTQAYIYTGDQNGQTYKIATNSDDELYWKCVDETYEADTKAGLVNNEYVQVFALGRVGSIYYRRNSDNTDWEAQNEFE